MPLDAPPATTSRYRHMVPAEVAAQYRRDGWWGEDAVGSLVARHAAAAPEAPAYLTEHGVLTWGAYDVAADRIAAALVAMGVAEGSRVAVWLPDGAAVHAALVGAERAGTTVVGLGARAGDRELRHLLRTTGARVLVTSSSHRGRDTAQVVAELRRDGVTLEHHLVLPLLELDPRGPLVLDGEQLDEMALAEGAAGVAGRALGPDDLFLLNSTSGTTGMPKCVMHTQNRWIYFHRVAVEHGGLDGDDVFFGAVPTPFGFGLWTSHVTPGVLGVPTVVRERFVAEDVLAAVERHRVTVLCCVSTQFIMMLNSPAIEQYDLSSLRVMFTGGEAVPFERARSFEAATGARVLQFFGSNETGLLSGTRLSDSVEDRLRTAGRVRPEMQVRLFDGDCDVTASGSGQPAGRGPATSLGYLDDDDANAQLVRPDGWMLMGDIVQVDDRGYLSVTGRTSDIIIRGGKNISAGQVEDEVGTHPSVALAAAVAAPDEVFGERVCVYVELRPGTALDLPELLGHLVDRGTSKEVLPEHLVVLDELPRSSGAKVAKGQLREDVVRRFGAGRDAPR
jgi:acyl-CoA synthetase